MRVSVLGGVVASVLFVGSAWGASYQRTDGTIVDPILCWPADVPYCESTHQPVSYSGPDVTPDVVSPEADMSLANVRTSGDEILKCAGVRRLVRSKLLRQSVPSSCGTNRHTYFRQQFITSAVN